jgi:Serine/Threonine/Tyrosine Kinase found in polyvalent proteins
MDLAEAETAALRAGSTVARTSLRVANVGEPRDPVTEWEERVARQFKALKAFAKDRGCLLKTGDLPPRLPGATPGREVTVYLDSPARRVWKSTFPGQSGFGHFGHFTPAGYLRRLRLSNLIFGDDVAFEGVLVRKEGPSLVTSQGYIQPHPGRFIPTEEEIAAFLRSLGFREAGSSMLWERDDGVELADTHDRNFIRTPDGSIVAIDVQPRLLSGRAWDQVIPWPQPGA